MSDGSSIVGVVRSLTLMESVFPGNSEMAARSRAFDWSKTAVGPVETWSQALRTTVSTMLSSRNPMFIFWGPEFTQFYNDGYRPSLGSGARHPGALGAEGAKFWTDVWHIIGPELEEARTGISTWHEDALIPIERNGSLENVWWTYGYSPVFDDDGTIGGVLVVCMETTKRHLVETERERLVVSLSSERATLASIFDLSPTFLAIARGPNHIFERVNAAYVTLVGQRELVGKSVADALPEVAEQGIFPLLDGVRETGEPFTGNQLPIKIARGLNGALETRYVNLVFQRIIDPDGEPLVIAHGVDVTDHVLAEKSLIRVELQLRDQFAKLPVSTILWKEEGNDFVLLDCNEAAVRAFPILAGTSVGKTTTMIFPERTHMAVLFRKALRENAVCEHTATVPSPGGLRTMEFTIGPHQPDRVLVHAVDITDRVELEEQLRQSQKMEAIGQLAGGIAHDFNNLLTVIEGHSSLLMDALGEDDDRYGDAEEINKAGVRAAGLTRQLLAFSNKQILRTSRVALNNLIDHTTKMLSRLLGENIGIVLELKATPDEIIGDASQYSQVLMNLALNARDAMNGHGTLTISTSNAAAPVVTNGMEVSEDGYVVLEISDAGTGISEEIRSRIFDPFFTTKPEGMGTGLGLATVYTIVTNASGFIFVESELDRGTKFTIYLPIASGPSEAVAIERDRPTPSINGETVLLVEDEVTVRGVVERMLVNQGYRVLTAEDGLSALRVSASERTIDLVISDAVMPGMGGAEVVAQLRKLRPELKALFMSGHTDDQVLRNGINAATVKFIQKPFAALDFAAAVRDALN